MHTSLSVFMNMNYLLWCDLTGVAGLVTVLVLLLMMALKGEKTQQQCGSYIKGLCYRHEAISHNATAVCIGLSSASKVMSFRMEEQ